jgi:hypothetical protein
LEADQAVVRDPPGWRGNHDPSVTDDAAIGHRERVSDQGHA